MKTPDTWPAFLEALQGALRPLKVPVRTKLARQAYIRNRSILEAADMLIVADYNNRVSAARRLAKYEQNRGHRK